VDTWKPKRLRCIQTKGRFRRAPHRATYSTEQVASSSGTVITRGSLIQMLTADQQLFQSVIRRKITR
jgi:hypothetical protein